MIDIRPQPSGDFDSDEMRLKSMIREFCIWSFVKHLGFLEENLDFRPSQLEKKENKNWVVYNYHEF
ncbi:hypothetical protein ACSBR1_014920 [Camellia fascicularis]